MAKQKLVRIYPHGYTNTGSRIDDINNLLSNGWKVAHITVIRVSAGDDLTDYILEETEQTEKTHIK